MPSTIDQRLHELGVTLPVPPSPAANYVPAMRSGNQLFIAGQTPVVDGRAQFVGKVGAGLSIEQDQQAARLCAINVLAQVARGTGRRSRTCGAGAPRGRVRQCGARVHRSPAGAQRRVRFPGGRVR